MSMKCITCDKQDTEHSKKLWELHQKKRLCLFCNEDSSQHSEKLWEIHQEVVPKNTKFAKQLVLNLNRAALFSSVSMLLAEC